LPAAVGVSSIVSTPAPNCLLLFHPDEGQYLRVRHLLPAREGYAVHWTTDLITARHALRTTVFDAALVDAGDIDGSGLEVLADLRAASVPAIALSGDERTETHALLLARGATDCLSPAELTEPTLRRAIRYVSERRRAERLLDDRHAALRRLASAHAHLAAIVQSSGDAIYSQSLDGAVISWNAGAERLYGYAAQEMLGRSVSILAPRGRRGEMQALLRRVAAGEVVPPLEREQVRKDGRRLVVTLTMSPVHDASAEMVSVSTIVRDVTEQRRVQAVLHESEALHRAMFDEAPVGVALLGRTGRWLRVNRRLLELLRYESAELLHMRLDELCAPEDAADDARIAAELLDGARRCAVHERRLRRGDGVWTWVRLNVSVYRPVPGPPRLVAMVEDISHGKQAEIELAQIFDLSPDMLCTATLDGHLTRVNAAFTQVLGYTTEELLRRPFLELVHPDDLDATMRELSRLREGHTTIAFANRYRVSDGSYKWLDWHSACDPSGGVIYAVARDRTERRQLEEQLRHAQKIDALGQLAGGVAHDFNNVLTAMTGFADLALQSLHERDPVRQEVEAIVSAGESAAALTRQLLAFSRRQLLRPERLDLNAVVGHISGLLRRLLGADITLDVTADSQLRAVEADRAQIEQVLLNLVLNARDAMARGGTVSVRLRNTDVDDTHRAMQPDLPPGSYVTVSVSDTGCGMTPEVRERVFEPFFTTKSPGKGTGLGLSTVYGIVKQSNGWISVESEPERGSTFTIHLPETTQPAVPQPPPGITAGRLDGTETILVIEDQPDVRQVVRQVLQRRGYRVLEADGHAQAIDAIERHGDRIQLLLTDVVLPGQSGPAIAADIVRRRPSLPVLYMSGYTENSMVRRGVLDRGLAFVEKPFTATSLLRAVRGALDPPGPATAA
jgi:two-component system, cell cycle sensor histidine kinase and response regulator CckA